ncbi:hypothetical protein ACIQXA_12235 [Streptomyces massasporeus]|uniref:hypothetical protein n=1 Tax=Streptomyces massasporeus TaxID=67324 RepID=UPI003812DC8C
MTDPESFGEGWIFEEGLRPFCETLAEFSGYEFDELDWQAAPDDRTRAPIEAALHIFSRLTVSSRGTGLLLVPGQL